jgi:elongator complex protein 5
MEAESQALPDPIEQDRAIDGVISTLGSNASQRMIISVEYRKKSGRTILENFTLDINTGKIDTLNVPVEKSSQEGMSLDFGTTFNLGMTQRQKETKEEIVLPHFSAQALSGDDNREGGVGHIEYTLDAEDDFDDEEDVDEDLLV